jgi:hypothetical protein
MHHYLSNARALTDDSTLLDLKKRVTRLYRAEVLSWGKMVSWKLKVLLPWEPVL